MNNQGPVAQPDLRSILDQERDNSYSGLNCVHVGTIHSFDASKHSASVRLVNARAVYNAPADGSAIPPQPIIYSYPLLVDVPVFVLNGGGAVLTMPIKAGDTCLVIFNDRDLDPWWTNGTTGAAPNSLRMHSLADGIALVGIRAAPQAFAGYSVTDTELKLAGGSLSVTDAGDPKAVSAAGGRIEVQAKIGIRNDATSLLSALNAVVTALSALNAVKVGGDASGTISAAQTLITNLLQ